MKTYLLLVLLFFSEICSAQVKRSENPNPSASKRLSALTCNNWLYTPSQPSYVGIGDLDIPGNKLTVEATINRTSFYSNGIITDGDIVSKHSSPPDANYILRPTRALITTTNGFFFTPNVCDIELNKTYHMAMTYDGTTLKFYRNGFLMSQVPATGNLIQNNWETRIGFFAPQNSAENFVGYINEVRIWNVAKTQAELRASMNSSLPNPSSQIGLLAYYTFNDLLNKQGNPAWDGRLGGTASINQTNPNCTFIADSCGISINPVTSIGGIINTYTPVTGFDPCGNKITVEDGSTFNAGDTVLMIQMKGAVIDSSNTSNFGTVTDYKNSGNYEFNYVKSKSGNSIELKNRVTRPYDIPTGKVQLIRVPYYNSVAISSTLTCLPWDGNKGGVLVFNVKDTLTLNSNIDVSGLGFRGGSGIHGSPPVFNCYENQYYYPANSDLGAQKGESITIVSSAKTNGKGKAANGGGGGNSHNSGGGGGSNGGSGGFGGYEFEGSACSSTVPFDNRGIGGATLNYNNPVNKIFVGGGGGAGHANNPELFYPEGGDGGGICIINAGIISGNNQSIISNGEDALACSGYGTTGCHEGMGGGGAGGTVLLNVQNYLSPVNVLTKGGKGGDMIIGGIYGRLGPGGGGGGGICWVNNSTTPSNLLVNFTGGTNGVTTGYSNNPWGATAGQAGAIVYGLKLPLDTSLFKPNIDSVRINAAATGCSSYNFNGLSYTNGNAIASWQWFFGDGGTATSQNTSHNYNTAGTYTVKLIGTDINGCKDSISINVLAGSGTTPDFSYQQNICNPLSIQFFSTNPNAGNPYWDFGDGTNVTGVLNPVHVYAAPGNYQIKHIDLNCGNSVVKTMLVAVVKDDIIITPDTTLCSVIPTKLRSVPSLSYCWSPTTYLDHPDSANPITSTPQNITYYLNAEVTGTNLVINGDFNNGNTGFSSQYTYATPNITEGQYFVGTDPQAWNPSLSACKDHTTAGGNMMLVNGSPTPDAYVWKQTISVTPNTNYAFSTWIESFSPLHPAQLQFSINGSEIGNLITASSTTCTWTQFYATWNSGNSATVTISIVNKNTEILGNDFALDDISFAPVFIKRDSVTITIEKVSVKTNADTTLCFGSSVQLNATGASSYTWTPSIGLSNSNIANPLATVTAPVTYIVSGTTTAGCNAKDTVSIAMFPKAVIATSNDTTICKKTNIQLFASGGVSYLWSPAASLSNPNIANPVASPASTTTYLVTVTDNNKCSYKDSVKITISNALYAVSADQTTCPNNQVQLTASGGTSYLWQPSTYLNNNAVPNPVTIPSGTITYSVKIKDSTCDDSTLLTTTVTVLPLPFVKASKSNDVDCSINFSQLNATGAQTYIWQPASSLNNNHVPNPLAKPTATTLFTVTGTDNKGCKNSDTVTVYVSNSNGGAYNIPNAFSPNNDGINDCFGLKYWGTVTKLEFSIYNRFGERIFYTTDAATCWDGRYKGIMQPVGIYVYTIKATTACDVVDKKGTFLLIR